MQKRETGHLLVSQIGMECMGGPMDMVKCQVKNMQLKQ